MSEWRTVLDRRGDSATVYAERCAQSAIESIELLRHAVIRADGAVDAAALIVEIEQAVRRLVEDTL